MIDNTIPDIVALCETDRGLDAPVDLHVDLRSLRTCSYFLLLEKKSAFNPGTA